MKEDYFESGALRPTDPNIINDLVFFIRNFRYNARRFVTVPNRTYTIKLGLNINKLNGDTEYVF